MLSRKQFVIKNTLIALLYPVIPLVSLIIMSYFKIGDEIIMSVLAIISILSVGFFFFLLFLIIPKKEYDDYVKNCKELIIPTRTETDFKTFTKYFFPESDIENDYFNELARNVSDGAKMIKQIKFLENQKKDIESVLIDIEKGQFFHDPVPIQFGPDVMINSFFSVQISRDELYYFLSKQKTLISVEIANLKKDFESKFPNKNTNE